MTRQATPVEPLGRRRISPRVFWLVALALLAGAVYLGVTRADAILLDLAALANCF